jgi:hypothetical protein
MQEEQKENLHFLPAIVAAANNKEFFIKDFKELKRKFTS